jgi:hypothetical protein
MIASVRIFAATLTLAFTVSGQLLAQVPYLSLHEKLGRTAVVCVQNAPSGFRDQLTRHKADTSVLRFADVNTPFLDADVWVFFLETDAKADQLPALAFKLFRSLQNRDENSVAHCVQFSLTNGAEKHACYFFLDKYDPGDTKHIIACKAAIAVHGSVSGTGTPDESRRMTSECIKGS